MKVILATGNPGKVRELKTAFAELDIALIDQQTAGVAEVEETGLTFVENALLKARHACRVTGMPAIADDSGLAVEALNGAPGIYSARYAGNQVPPEQHIEKLLADLANSGSENRNAAFHCILVYLNTADDPVPLVCQGIWHGSILPAPKGKHGFGYDPIFYVPTENKSAAELSLTTKNHLSHRGQALRLLLQQLPEKLCQHSQSKI